MKTINSILLTLFLVIPQILNGTLNVHAQGPSTAVLDDFDRADGTLGINWSGTTSGYGIVSNRMDVGGSGGTIFWGTPFGTDQELFVTLTTIDSAGSQQALQLKSQSATTWSNGAIEVLYDAANKRVQVWTYSSAQGWVQRGGNISVTLVNGDQFGARAKTNGTVEVYRNGALIGSQDASGWNYSAGGGYIGFWFIASGNTILDNFSGGTVTTGSTNTPLPLTPTNTSTRMPTGTLTTTPTLAPTLTPTNTPTSMSTVVPTNTSTSLPTLISTHTSTYTPTVTMIGTSTLTPTFTPTVTSVNTSTGYPSTNILDNFNRANGTPGTNWSGITSGYSIASNRLDVGSGGEIFWGTQFGSDQEAFITLTTIDPAGTQQTLQLKSQSKTTWSNGAIEVLYDAVSKRVQVWTYSNAQGWVQRGANIPVTLVNGDRLGARAKANGIVDVYRNNTLIGSRDASAWTYAASGGYIGLWFINSRNTLLDDFGGRSVASAVPTSTLLTPVPTNLATNTPTKTPTLAVTNTSTRTPTNTPVFTATNTPTSGSTNTPTNTPVPGSMVFFPIGAGGADVVPHQVVRTNTDFLYIFTSQQSSAVLRVYRTTSAGLPNDASAFAASIQFTESNDIISVDAVYDGGTIIHTIINTQSGQVKDYPFDTSTNTFKTAITLASDGGTIGSGLYIGTSGISGMVDLGGTLHITYWTNGNHILHRAYTYNSVANTLTPLGAFSQVDITGNANHPSIAVSPVDNSLTVAWVSQSDSPTKIRTRTRADNGTWGSVELASTYPSVSVWTSPDNGLNIDQGPSLLIDSMGIKHMAYIESFNAAFGDYGRIHYVTNSGSGWVDTGLNVFTHDPALALSTSGNLYIIGHGHPKNIAGSSQCISTFSSMDNMCYIKKNTDGSWGNPMLFAAPPSGSSFDSSPSVKWSVVGFNRSNAVEFIFFKTPYDSPTVYYGRLP